MPTTTTPASPGVLSMVSMGAAARRDPSVESGYLITSALPPAVSPKKRLFDGASKYIRR